MKTQNKKLLKVKDNQKYYSHSDGNFMPLDRALVAHRFLDRVAWIRDWVHKLDSKSHIDLGCKDGYTCLTLAAEGIRCLGVDPSEDAIDEAITKNMEAKLDCEFVNDFAENIKGVYADTVSVSEVIEHVVDPDKLLDVADRIGIYVMVTTPDIDGRHGLEDSKRNQEHVRVYSKKELEELISKHGTIMESIIRDDSIYIIYRVQK